MSDLRHWAYRAIVRLHPAAFRREFGREMVLDFEDAQGSHGVVALYWDALLSLVRQWTARGWLGQVEGGVTSRPSLLNGQYVMICQDEMTPLEFVRGMVLSVTFLTQCAFAETHVTTSDAILLPVNHMGPVSSQQGSSSAASSAESGDVAGPGAGRRTRQPMQKVPSSDSNGKVPLLAGAVGSTMNMGSGDGQAGTTPMGCKTNLTPAYGSILHACGPLPSFEVVSIRPWKPAPSPPPPPPPPTGGTTTVPRRERFAPGRGGGPSTDHMRIILPTELLVAAAYGLPLGFENRVIGRTDWMGSDQYEILAKIEESQFAAMQKMTPAEQRGQVALMEQSLLADRYKLKVHFEEREMPVYALVVTKGGPKLTPAKEGEKTKLSVIDVEQGIQMNAVSVTLEQWIESPFLGGRTVVDQTGLKGAYDFTLTWGRQQPETSDARPGAAPPILTAIPEQLGLKLVPTKAPVEVIIIDHIERPSEN